MDCRCAIHRNSFCYLYISDYLNNRSLIGKCNYIDELIYKLFNKNLLNSFHFGYFLSFFKNGVL